MCPSHFWSRSCSDTLVCGCTDTCFLSGRRAGSTKPVLCYCVWMLSNAQGALFPTNSQAELMMTMCICQHRHFLFSLLTRTQLKVAYCPDTHTGITTGQAIWKMRRVWLAQEKQCRRLSVTGLSYLLSQLIKHFHSTLSFQHLATELIPVGSSETKQLLMNLWKPVFPVAEPISTLLAKQVLVITQLIRQNGIDFHLSSSLMECWHSMYNQRGMVISFPASVLFLIWISVELFH